MPVVLNVGGGSKAIAIPGHYAGWDRVLLDIDAKANPDIVCDARQLESLDSQQFDAVYCAHNLEHYHRHDVPKVLRGFRHVLKQDGFAEVRVPDIEAVMQRAVLANMDLDDVLYQSEMGPIAVADVIYGLGREIEQSGQEYYAHKTGFTPKSLRQTMQRAGFPVVYNAAPPTIFEARVLAFMMEPTAAHYQLLDFIDPENAPTEPVQVSITLGRVIGGVQINLVVGGKTIYGCSPVDWPLEDNSVSHLTCKHVLEYLTGTERIAFMEECGRVLPVGGTMLVTFHYATARQASSDPMLQWPPLTEFSFDYFNRSWRAQNGCAYPITCDFDFRYSLDLEPSLVARNQEFKNFTTKHYNQSVLKMHGLMTKRS